jgi:diamine N-acetyltransferase
MWTCDSDCRRPALRRASAGCCCACSVSVAEPAPSRSVCLSGRGAAAPLGQSVRVSIELEVVDPEHAAELAKLKAETFVETFAEANDPDHVRAHLAREFSAEAVRRSLEDDDSTTWWLSDHGVPVGFLKVNRGHAQTEAGLSDGLEVEQLYVLAAHHGRGHGSRLIEHAISTARAEGYPFIWLGVWEHNSRAIAVYEHLGFVPIGDHTFLFGNEEQRDVLMRRDL